MTDERIIDKVKDLTEDSVRTEINLTRYIREVFEPLSKYAKDTNNIDLADFIADALEGANVLLKCERGLLEEMVCIAMDIAGMTTDEIRAMAKAPAPRRKALSGIALTYDPISKKMVRVDSDDLPDELREFIKGLEGE